MFQGYSSVTFDTDVVCVVVQKGLSGNTTQHFQPKVFAKCVMSNECSDSISRKALFTNAIQGSLLGMIAWNSGFLLSQDKTQNAEFEASYCNEATMFP